MVYSEETDIGWKFLWVSFLSCLNRGEQCNQSLSFREIVQLLIITFILPWAILTELISSRCMNQAVCSDFQKPENGSLRCECFSN